MKKILIFILSLLLIGCASTGLEKRVDDLEKEMARVKLMGSSGRSCC